MPIRKNSFLSVLLTGLLLIHASVSAAAADKQQILEKAGSVSPNSSTEKGSYKDYLDFFEDVFKTMQDNYYLPVSRPKFDRFVKKFKNKIYSDLKGENKSVDYIRWRSAAYMVEDLKDQEDTFSAFMPPKFADTYEKSVLGKRVDLGIEGKLFGEGFLVTQIEPRSDAYIKGLRLRDLIVAIDRKAVKRFTEDQLKELLTPLDGAKVALEYVPYQSQEPKEMDVISQEYFKQSVFLVPVRIPGVFCLSIPHFNRMTGEDMFRFLAWIEKQGDTSLIIDLRGNPGGPPLAAREISGFFLKPGEEFAYFQKKGQPKALLTVPAIPSQFHYDGNIAILVDKGSGSASELFSGVLQNKGRARLVGTNTAGKVLLKSMFYFDDKSMVLLVTSRGHFPDGKTFSFNGLVPDKRIEAKDADLVNSAALYLKSQKSTKQN